MSSDDIFGIARKTIFWMIAGFLIVMVILGFAIVLGSYQSKLTYLSPKLKADLISLRFANIPECFAYQDPVSGRVYPGIVDLNKFNNEQLFGCYHTNPEKGFKDYNFGLKLLNEDKFVHTNKYYNKIDFTITKKVLVKNGDEISKDDLYIYVQKIIGEKELPLFADGFTGLVG